MNYWKVFCMEDSYPGLWQRWFRNQCVAVGWYAKKGYTLIGGDTDKGWSEARNALKEISEGDRILVQLKNNRVGRVGEVVRKQIADDEWAPLVPPSQTEPDGEMGRRVLVRWDLTVGPPNSEFVVKLPPSERLPTNLVRPTIRRLNQSTFNSVVDAMNDEANWVSLLARFGYESSLSDYIGTFPHRLEDGLQPFPSAKVRERVFCDGTRSDVLLIDRDERPVIVECKQGTPTGEHVRQLRKYMEHLNRETGKETRGILVHGGARKLHREVREEIKRKPRIEVVQYSLNVEFAPCK